MGSQGGNNTKLIKMSKSKLFQYAIIWHPTEKQVKDNDAKSKVLKDLTTILATDLEMVKMTAIMELPSECKDQLDQIELAVRPF